ncbi:MAG: hypothetical protein AAF125_16395 [Chloroflexota bacterium]
MRRNRDLPGKLVVLRNANGDPRIGVVTKIDATAGTFEAIMQGSTATHHQGDTFVWSLGEWRGNMDDVGQTKRDLNALLTRAESTIERVLPFAQRKLLVIQAELVNPLALIASPAPNDEADYERFEVEMAAAVLALARDGAVNTGEGLQVERALPNGPVEQNVARDAALVAFPDEARLRKVGILQHKHTLILNFDFPEAARHQYDDLIRALEMETGWEASVRMTTNQQALLSYVREILPSGVALTKTPSLYADRKEIEAYVQGVVSDDLDALQNQYEATTGYSLVLNLIDGTAPNLASVEPSVSDGSGPMEINAAYGVVRAALEPYGLKKVGLKHGEIVLTFVSPQVGERYAAQFDALATQTGYPIRLSRNPMQNIILDEARALIRSEGWQASKGPGIHTDRGEVSAKLVEQIGLADAARVSEQLEARTGYRLVIG